MLYANYVLLMLSVSSMMGCYGMDGVDGFVMIAPGDESAVDSSKDDEKGIPPRDPIAYAQFILPREKVKGKAVTREAVQRAIVAVKVAIPSEVITICKNNLRLYQGDIIALQQSVDAKKEKIESLQVMTADCVHMLKDVTAQLALTTVTGERRSQEAVPEEEQKDGAQLQLRQMIDADRVLFATMVSIMGDLLNKPYSLDAEFKEARRKTIITMQECFLHSRHGGDFLLQEAITEVERGEDLSEEITLNERREDSSSEDIIYLNSKSKQPPAQRLEGAAPHKDLKKKSNFALPAQPKQEKKGHKAEDAQQAARELLTQQKKLTEAMRSLGDVKKSMQDGIARNEQKRIDDLRQMRDTESLKLEEAQATREVCKDLMGQLKVKLKTVSQ